jgi:quercetin 2,3-dioxygenase
MEIVTYILSGELTHKDSMGTSETLSRGSIQFMTAGTGVEHEEHNLSKENDLRFIQTWIMPRKRGLKPNYGSFSADTALENDRNNKWLHMVGDQGSDGSSKIQINQDCNLYVTEIEAGVCVNFELKEGRQAYLLCVEGSATVNGSQLLRHEACELIGGSDTLLDIEGMSGDEKTHCMLFEMSAGG